MTNQTLDNNKRIAKNAFLLYIRMLFLMIISLCTSRVILHALGVVDYGIHNVVGGVIAMLNFINNSLSAASSRFITYDIGQGNLDVMKKTFGNILCIHFIIAGFILLIGETIGLWFMMTQLQIPENRYVAAFWVYQFSVFTSIISIISVPYNAAIIGHEKMSAFAYISIIEAVLKLLIVVFLIILPFDKLIIYAIMLFMIQVIVRLVYGIYCKKNFEEVNAKIKFDKKIFNKIFSFAGWTMTGNLAVMGYTQGLNILLNIFYGPAVNAARGLAVQVQTACRQFCANFQMALNPQLTKSYAQGNLPEMHNLLNKSSKFSYYILFIITLPLLFETDFILKLWLSEVPNHTSNFLRLILITGLIYSLANPLIVSVHATGDIKKFQIIEGFMLLTIVPISYICYKLWKIEPECFFVIHLVVEFVTQYARLKIVLPMINMELQSYIKNVVFPVLLVTAITPIIPYILYFSCAKGFGSFILICMTCTILNVITIYTLGLSKGERKFFKNKLSQYIMKHE